MSAERIDPTVIEAAIDAFEKAPEYDGAGPDTTDRVAMEAAIRAADEKRRELAQAVPEGQEYVYRTCWRANGETWRGRLVKRLSVAVRQRDEKAHLEVWVERALLGTWEKLD
jgi:hypothetical protein